MEKSRIASLGVKWNEVSNLFQLQNEGEDGNFWVSGLRKDVTICYILHSKALQKRWFKQEAKGNSNRVNTSTTGETVGAHLVGPAFDEEW